jgi:hypothetical protein
VVSPPDFADKRIERAVPAWLIDATGLEASAVRWYGEGGRPALPYIGLQEIGAVDVGTSKVGLLHERPTRILVSVTAEENEDTAIRVGFRVHRRRRLVDEPLVDHRDALMALILAETIEPIIADDTSTNGNNPIGMLAVDVDEEPPRIEFTTPEYPGWLAVSALLGCTIDEQDDELFEVVHEVMRDYRIRIQIYGSTGVHKARILNSISDRASMELRNALGIGRSSVPRSAALDVLAGPARERRDSIDVLVNVTSASYRLNPVTISQANFSVSQPSQ